MGRNHTRVLSGLPSAKLVGIFDPDTTQAALVASEYGSIAFPSVANLIAESDAVVIAAPTTTHRDLALQCIAASKPALIEKPLAANAQEAEEIQRESQRRGALIQVGHIERFSPVVGEVRSILTRERPLAFSMRRMSPPTPRIEVDVVHDLMIHDLDLALLLTGQRPVFVSAVASGAEGLALDLVMAHMLMDGGVVCDFTGSKVAQHKIRDMMITVEDALITVDHINHSITIYRRSLPTFTTQGGNSRFREENVVEKPYISYVEPLRRELEHFIWCVATGATPEVSVREGLEALRLAHIICDRAAAASGRGAL